MNSLHYLLCRCSAEFLLCCAYAARPIDLHLSVWLTFPKHSRWRWWPSQPFRQRWVMAFLSGLLNFCPFSFYVVLGSIVHIAVLYSALCRFPQPPNKRDRDHTVVMKMTLIFPVTKCVRCSGRRVRFFVPVQLERGYFYLLERFVTRLELDGNDDF